MKGTKKLYFWLLVAFATVFISAAYSETPPVPNFTGVIVDRDEGAPMPRTRVWIHEDNGKRSFSVIPDRIGHFSLHLPDGYYDVLFSASGFTPFCKKIWVHDGKVITLAVRLGPDVDTSQVD